MQKTQGHTGSNHTTNITIKETHIMELVRILLMARHIEQVLCIGLVILLLLLLILVLGLGLALQ